MLNGEAILTETGGRPEADGESDRLIVLRARESRVHGEGAGKVTQPAKGTSSRHEGLGHEANLPAGNSEQSGIGQGASIPEPVWTADGGISVVVLAICQQASGRWSGPGRGKELSGKPTAERRGIGRGGQRGQVLHILAQIGHPFRSKSATHSD